MRSRFGILVLSAGVMAGVLLAAAIAVWHGISAGAGQNHANLTGTIQIGQDGDGCQRFVIDNRTGVVRQDHRVTCREAPKDSKTGASKESKTAAPKDFKRPAEASETPRYSSGGRIDAVRDSFNNR